MNSKHLANRLVITGGVHTGHPIILIPDLEKKKSFILGNICTKFTKENFLVNHIQELQIQRSFREELTFYRMHIYLYQFV
jgi:hypothetical protein